MIYRMMGLAALSAATPAAAQPVEITAQVMVEQRQAAADGTRIALVPAGRVTPGDAVVYRFAYRNRGAQPAANLVLANPIPATLAYAGPAANSPAPEVSLNGTMFAPLAALRVPGISGVERAATPADVRAVRWRLPAPVAAGASGEVSFRATVR